MNRMHAHDRYANAVRLPSGDIENFTVRVGGKLFRCSCGCNVFHKPDQRFPGLYECNACEARFESE